MGAASGDAGVTVSGHTPGPWTAKRFTGGLGATVASLGETVDGDHWAVTAIHRVADRELPANANLMAGAPDLLKEAKAIIAIWDQTGAPQPGTRDHPLRAAVAKAIGQEATR